MTRARRWGKGTGRAEGRTQGRGPSKGGQIADMVMIYGRPAEVEDRAVPRLWEGALIIGKAGKSAVGALVSRSSRLVMLLYRDGERAAAPVRRSPGAHSHLPLPQKPKNKQLLRQSRALNPGQTTTFGVTKEMLPLVLTFHRLHQQKKSWRRLHQRKPS